MELARLLHPRTVAVVGATERAGSYAGQTLLNLRAMGFPGEVWGVNPGRSSAHGFPCFASLGDCPSAPDAVVVAIPAAGVPAVVEEAGAIGCGGAVVYGAGFGEIAAGLPHEEALRAAAARHGLPVCGPNGNGIVALHERLALWGDALNPQEPGRVALVSQSGNVAVNALATRRGLRLHTVISCGNSTALDPSEWILELARDEGVASIALYLEADGDGVRLCEALAACAERGVGVSVLKVGASRTGAAAAAAHTGAVAGDQRVFRALVEEAGAAWAEDVHELLELAKAQAVPRAPVPAGGATGLAVLTCSGGDSALAADECERLGLPLPPLGGATAARLRELLPDAATVANPLDYTALIWGETDTLRDIVAAVGADPAIDQVLVLHDQPVGLEGEPSETWAAVREGILRGAGASPAPVLLASTLPELLDDAAAVHFARAGVPAIAGLRTGVACAAALRRQPPEPGRLREIAAVAAAARAGNGAPGAARPLAEHEAKDMLRAARLPVVDGRVVASEDDAARSLDELGGPVVLKLSSPALLHKTEIGALALDLRSSAEVRHAHRRLAEVRVEGAHVLVERMAAAGLEMIVAARRDAVVPALVVGLGGLWAELHDDVAIVPLPVTPARAAQAMKSLKGAATLEGRDIDAAAALAAQLAAAAVELRLELLECNPILVHRHGAVVVDATAKEVAT